MNRDTDEASWQDWLVDSGDRGMLGFVLDLAECAWILCVGVGGWARGRLVNTYMGKDVNGNG